MTVPQMQEPDNTQKMSAPRAPRWLLGLLVGFALAESILVYFHDDDEALQFILRIVWCMLAGLSLGSNDSLLEFPQAAGLGTLAWAFCATDLAHIFTLPSIALWSKVFIA